MVWWGNLSWASTWKKTALGQIKQFTKHTRQTNLKARRGHAGQATLSLLLGPHYFTGSCPRAPKSCTISPCQTLP
eukprot:5631490-Amphidinium_carterae.1